MAQKLETVFEVKRGSNSQLLSVKAIGQKAAATIDKKFSEEDFQKILKGFKIDGIFFPFTPPKIYGRV